MSLARVPLDDDVHDVVLEPAAVAMVWTGPDTGHQAFAIPCVRLAAGEVLVRVEMATICGSDVHTVAGHRAAPSPLVLGHEYVGRIVQLGPGPTAAYDGTQLAIGDRIIWSIMASCGTCDRCTKGLSQKCRSLRKYGHEQLAPGWELSGGFASHIHLRAGTTVVRVGEMHDPHTLAPVACGTATAWSALRRAEHEVGRLAGVDVLISGAGLIGLSAAAMASDRGARVVLSDPNPARATAAARFGAAELVHPSELADRRFDVIVEASGSPGAVAAAITATDVGGVIVLVGSVFPSDPVPLHPEHLVRHLGTVTGVHNYAPRDLADAAEWVQRRCSHYPFGELVGQIFPLDRIDEAINTAASGRSVRVAVVAS